MESTEFFKYRSKIMEETEKSILISRNTTCPLCKKKIENVFARYPNGIIICYQCFETSNPNQCPVTKTIFKKEST